MNPPAVLQSNKIIQAEQLRHGVVLKQSCAIQPGTTSHMGNEPGSACTGRWEIPSAARSQVSTSNIEGPKNSYSYPNFPKFGKNFELSVQLFFLSLLS